MRIEINSTSYIKSGQEELLFLHNILNMINIICGNIFMLTTAHEDNVKLKEGLVAAHGAAASFRTNQAVDARLWQKTRDSLARALATITPPKGLQVADEIQLVNRVMERIDTALKMYIAGYAKRICDWQDIPTSIIEQEIKQVLGLMALNSRGRFQVAYNNEVCSANSYLIRLTIGDERGKIYIPMALQETIIDLLANARKYSQPGSEIIFNLKENLGVLNLEVTDNGRGIAAEDLTKVVEFGYRGTNIGVHESSAGGFGLTKAYHLCRSLGGRMWIDSELAEGTKVLLEIPQPDRQVTNRT